MRYVFLIFLMGTAVSVPAQKVIQLLSTPTNTPPESTIYLAASENGWNPGDPEWAFENHLLTLPPETPAVFQGKFTRGSWETVEGNAQGGFLPNRQFDFSAGDTLGVHILSWEGEGTFDDLPDNLFVFDEAFYMPGVDRTRRIRVLLPQDYADTDLHYPVLYMHDGQNLFSQQESFAGEWEVDEAMDNFSTQGYPGAIIVAIDNGGAHRIAEYTPYANSTYGGGDGQAYIDFIADHLKPAIDDSLRTLTDRHNTGIMGSSLGGLISFYAGLYRPEIFAKIGALSPSFWFSDSIYVFAADAGYTDSGLFYFLAGGQEGQNVIGDVNSMVDLMEAGGHPLSDLRVEFDPAGAHSEWFWAARFPEAFAWLFIDSSTGVDRSAETENPLKIFPNPARDSINLVWPEGGGAGVLRVHDMSGRLAMTTTVTGVLDISELAPGTYRISVEGESNTHTAVFVKL